MAGEFLLQGVTQPPRPLPAARAATTLNSDSAQAVALALSWGRAPRGTFWGDEMLIPPALSQQKLLADELLCLLQAGTSSEAAVPSFVSPKARARGHPCVRVLLGPSWVAQKVCSVCRRIRGRVRHSNTHFPTQCPPRLLSGWLPWRH